MEIKVKRTDDAVQFQIENASGVHAQIDGPPAIGGQENGLRPMETLLGAVATCSAFDLVSILKKQRQELRDLNITVRGEREKQESVTPFTAIQLHFEFTGDLDPQKVERATDLAVNKYCSVKASLHPDIEVSYTINIKQS